MIRTLYFDIHGTLVSRDGGTPKRALANGVFQAAGRLDVFYQERGRRIFLPDPDGNGDDILMWLARSGC